MCKMVSKRSRIRSFENDDMNTIFARGFGGGVRRYQLADIFYNARRKPISIMGWREYWIYLARLVVPFVFPYVSTVLLCRDSRDR
jgi:hypothetical protein